MSLDRILDMARSLAGKTVPLQKKVPARKEKKSSFCEASTFLLLMETFFWMFVVRKPLPPQVAWLPTSLALTCIDKRQFFFPIMTGYWAHFCKFSIGYIFGPQKYPVPNWIALETPFRSGTPKEFLSVWYRAHAAHSDAIWEHWEL